jgi:hypothetical protein
MNMFSPATFDPRLQGCAVLLHLDEFERTADGTAAIAFAKIRPWGRLDARD